MNRTNIAYPLFLCAMVLCAALRPHNASATHAAGAELLYEWVGDSTYRLIYKFYKDCAGLVDEPGAATICYYSECDGFAGSVTLPKKAPADGVELGTGCPGYPTRCSGASYSLPGYKEFVYEGTVTLPSRCHTWRFFFGVNARNNAITNLQNPGSQVLYVEATLNNEAAQGNSSPYFTVKPVPYICIYTPYTFNNGAADLNGDVLRYENIQPRTSRATCLFPPLATDIPYAGGFSLPSDPFATGNSFFMDTITGHISFTPTAVQIAVISIRVREYRNGVEIGSVMRDIQIIVRSDCSTPPLVGVTDESSIVNGYLEGDRVEGCANTPLEFCVDLKSPLDPASVLVATDNHSWALPGATLTYRNQQTDAVRACVSWLPGIRDTGLHVLYFTVKDSTCRPPGLLISQIFTVPVFIHAPVEALRDTAICPQDSVQLLARGWSPFTWSALPGGSPLSSLSCTDCADPVARPDRTTQYVVASDKPVCAKSRDTVTVTVLPSPGIATTPDTTTCVNNQVVLGVAVGNHPPGTYQVAWTPFTGLDDAAKANPVASPPDDITYHVKVSMNDGGCSAYDSVRVTVLQGYDLLNRDTAICIGDTIAVRMTGDPRYAYRWTPAAGVSDTGIMQPAITPDSTRTYVVTASYPGCRDSVRSFAIDVQPVPVVDLGADQILCYGDTFRLHPVITPPDYPLYTYTWNPGGGLAPGPDVAGPVFTAAATTTLTLTVSTPAGCVGSDDILMNVAGPDILSVSPDTVICPGDTIRLHVWGTQVSQLWRPAYYISDTLAADPYVYPESSVIYRVYGRDKDNCLDTQAVRVAVAPAAVVSLPDSARIYPGESYRMDPGGNCLYFEWFPPLGLTSDRIMNPVATPDVNTRYFVTARTEYGCIATDSIDLYVNPDSYVDMPNAFVPGTGPNNTLRPVRRGIITLKSFSVYNRWGARLFETSDMDAGWDGTYHGRPQPVGVYVYVVDAVTPAGRVFHKQGNVTLLR